MENLIEEIEKKEINEDTFETICNNIFSELSDEEFDVFDISKVIDFAHTLPKEITIKRLSVFTNTLREDLISFLDIIYQCELNEKTFKNLFAIFSKINTNTNFDYYKEVLHG